MEGNYLILFDPYGYETMSLIGAFWDNPRAMPVGCSTSPLG